MSRTTSLTQVTTKLAATLAVAAAIVLPLIYLLFSYQFEKGNLQAETQATATIIERLLQENPALRPQEATQLKNLLHAAKVNTQQQRFALLDADGVQLSSYGFIAAPTLSRTISLNGTGENAGLQIKISRSLRPTIFNGRPYLLLGLLLGGILFTLLRALPLKALAKAEKSRQESEEHYRILVENQTDMMVKLDPGGNILFASPSFCEKFAAEEKLLIGQNINIFVNSDDLETKQHALQVLLKPPYRCYYEHRTQTDEGLRWLGWSEKLLFDSKGKMQAIVGMGRDITDRKHAEDEIQQLAYYDSLTNLPNRRLLLDRLKQSILHAERDNHQMSVLFLDLDRFKNVNDSLGHDVGDQLLQQLAIRISGCLRETDTVARLGGDEFILLLPKIKSDHEDYVTLVAQKVLHSINKPIILNGRELFISSSIGISVYPNDGSDAKTLMKNADLAMYQAKEYGRNNFQFFSAELNEKVQEQLLLEHSLRRALENEEFFLVYQPKMDLAKGVLSGMECLLRWRHPELGLVCPDRFIPIAEETGLINDIGEWTLRTACKQLHQWLQAGFPALPMAVNMAGNQLKHGDLVATIDRILLETEVPPQLLELELTESSIMSSAETTIKILKQLKALDVSVAIDDFGTGYSSLSYLKYFPIDRIKIDRTFINDINPYSDDSAITKAIIAMAQSLQLEVTAEGVENEDQLNFLIEHNCNEIQGYLYSRPLSIDDMENFLKKEQIQKGSKGSHLRLV